MPFICQKKWRPPCREINYIITFDIGEILNFLFKNRWQINLIKHVDNFNKCKTAIDCLIRSTVLGDAVETRNGLILAALGQHWDNVGTVLTRLCGSGAQARTHGGEGNPEETQSHPSSRSAPLGPLLQFQQSVGSIITSSLCLLLPPRPTSSSLCDQAQGEKGFSMVSLLHAPRLKMHSKNWNVFVFRVQN